RTCALRAMRNSERRRKGQKEEVGFCPLDLWSQNQEQVLRALRVILERAKIPESSQSKLTQRVLQWVKENDVLGRLAELQQNLDAVGVFETDLMSKAFLTVTTLRDCTVF